MEDFHRGPYETAVDTARSSPRSGSRSAERLDAYAKVERRAGDWAVTSAGAAVWMEGGVITDARVGLAAVGPNTTGIPAIRRCCAARALGRALRAGGRIAAEGCSPSTDNRGNADYKRHLADELTRRTLRLCRATHQRASPAAATGKERLMQVTMSVNGESVTREIEGRMLLVHFLRDELGLTGTHWGCDTSNCGTCVAWLDGEPVKTCTVLAAMAGGREVRTVEGLELRGARPGQEGFMRCHGLQCGFCTPGMLMTARALLDREPDPSEDTIREAISGQNCRCTGYTTIVADPVGGGARKAAARQAETVGSGS